MTEPMGLASAMMVNNEIGTIEPIRGLANVAHQRGALFHADAVHSVGHIKVDVEELGVDMLSASAHKFNGPKGVGFLYIRKGNQIHSLNDGGAQEYGLRAGTENIASIVGMVVALQKNCEALDENTKKISRIESLLLASLHQRNCRFVRNGGGEIAPGIISLSFPGAGGEAILYR